MSNAPENIETYKQSYSIFTPSNLSIMYAIVIIILFYIFLEKYLGGYKSQVTYKATFPIL